MKISCVDVITRYTKNGNSFVQGAFRGIGKLGDPFLFVANCPSDYEPLKDYDARVIFSSSGNFILPY